MARSILVTHRLSTVAAIWSAQQLSRFGVDGNALAIAPVAFYVDLVAARLQQPDRIRGKAHTFDINFVGLPLMMKTRRIHRGLDVQPVVHYSHQNVGYGGDNTRPAWRTKHKKQLSVLKNNSWGHGAQRALTRRNRVGLALDQSVAVGHPRLGG